MPLLEELVKNFEELKSVEEVTAFALQAFPGEGFRKRLTHPLENCIALADSDEDYTQHCIEFFKDNILVYLNYRVQDFALFHRELCQNMKILMNLKENLTTKSFQLYARVVSLPTNVHEHYEFSIGSGMNVIGNVFHAIALTEHGVILSGCPNLPPMQYVDFTLIQKFKVAEYEKIISESMMAVGGNSILADDLGFFKQSPLHMAIGFDNNHAAMAFLMVIPQLTPDQQQQAINGLSRSEIVNSYCCGPAHLAIQRGNRMVFRQLAENPYFDPNLKDKTGASLLDWAVKMGEREFIEILLKKGANPENVIRNVNLQKIKMDRQITAHFWNNEALFEKIKERHKLGLRACKQLIDSFVSQQQPPILYSHRSALAATPLLQPAVFKEEPSLKPVSLSDKPEFH